MRVLYGLWGGGGVRVNFTQWRWLYVQRYWLYNANHAPQYVVFFVNEEALVLN